MNAVTSTRQFGLLIAYVVPGFIALAGLAPLFPAVAAWLRPAGTGLGPPIYALVAATAIGQILSCFRWLLLDHIHVATGIERPDWNDELLEERLGAFDYVVQSHFRYAEFTGNTLLAVLFAYTLNRLQGTLPFLGLGTDLGIVILITVLFAASRDALAKYYTRTGRLVGVVAEEIRGEVMYNGNDHGGSEKPQPKPEAQPRKDSPADSQKVKPPAPSEQRSQK